SPISQRLGPWAFPGSPTLVPVTTGMVHHALPHWVVPYNTRITSTATRPQVREPYKATPAAPARSKVGTIPSGVRPMARTLPPVAAPAPQSAPAPPPSRYTDMAKIPTTTEFSP